MQMSIDQLKLIRQQIAKLCVIDGFYADRLRGVDAREIKSQEDFEQLGFTGKEDLRDAYPLGLMAVPPEDVVRIHSSSGTTGKPVIIPYTQKDVDDWAAMFARCYQMAGVTPLDRIHITPGYGLWTAGHRLSGRGGKAGRDGRTHGPRQHREAAANDDRHGNHRALRHLLLRAAVGRGGGAAQPVRSNQAENRRDRLGALG